MLDHNSVTIYGLEHSTPLLSTFCGNELYPYVRQKRFNPRQGDVHVSILNMTKQNSIRKQPQNNLGHIGMVIVTNAGRIWHLGITLSEFGLI